MFRVAQVIKTKIRRFVNQLDSTRMASQGNILKRHKNNPVLGDKETGILFDPCVIKHEDAYRMFVSRRTSSDVALYESLDGIKWTYVDVALAPSSTDSWDNVVNRASVLRLDESVWYMWYTGQNRGRSAIGLAISTDGVHFSRHGDRPILVPRIDQGEEAVMNPCVIRDGSQFIMFYAAGENYEPDRIWRAKSLDGIDWEIEDKCVLAADVSRKFEQYKVGGGCVLRRSEFLYLFYIGYMNLDVAHICIARSSNNGEDWVRAEYPILTPEKGSWDCHAVYKSHACLNGNKLLIWYNGRNNKEEYIGLAICDDFEKIEDLFASENESSSAL